MTVYCYNNNINDIWSKPTGSREIKMAPGRVLAIAGSDSSGGAYVLFYFSCLQL